MFYEPLHLNTCTLHFNVKKYFENISKSSCKSILKTEGMQRGRQCHGYHTEGKSEKNEDHDPFK